MPEKTILVIVSPQTNLVIVIPQYASIPNWVRSKIWNPRSVPRHAKSSLWQLCGAVVQEAKEANIPDWAAAGMATVRCTVVQ